MPSGTDSINNFFIRLIVNELRVSFEVNKKHFLLREHYY